jgi:hypothetical protein
MLSAAPKGGRYGIEAEALSPTQVRILLEGYHRRRPGLPRLCRIPINGSGAKLLLIKKEPGIYDTATEK